VRARVEVLIEAGDREGVLRLTAGDDDGRVTVRWDPDDGESTGLTDAFRALVEEAGLHMPARVDVSLAPPVVQVRALKDLPPVREKDLHKLVDNQKDRLFRPVPGDACLAVGYRQQSGEEPLVRAALADAGLLAAVEEAVAELGGRVERFEVGLEDDAAPLVLRTASMIAREARRRRRGLVAAVSLLLAAWTSAAAVYVGDLVLDDRVLRAQLDTVRVALARTDSLEARLAAFAGIAAAFRRQGPSAAWAAPRLREVVGLVPAVAHLHSLRIEREGVVTLEVHAPDAAAVVDSLSSLPGYRVRDGAPPEDANAPYVVVLEVMP
jgi:hypothetical protein